MRFFAIGDIVGLSTIDFLKEKMWELRRTQRIDFVVANGENVCDIHGIGAAEAKALLDCGIDLLTSGNHVWSRKDIVAFLEGSEEMIRPCNFPVGTPGSGYTIRNVDGWRLLAINAMGCVYMDALSSPFETVNRILDREKGNYDISLLDFHAEATSEKLAMGYYFDGRIDMIFGTHTHIQTADERILPKGSGYITDLGMTGPSDGILGTSKECVIARFLTKMPQKFLLAEGKIVGNGVIFELHPSSRKIKSVTRCNF